MDFGENMCKITPNFKIFKHIDFFSIDDEGRVDASFCLVCGDYEALHYISYALTRVLTMLKTP